MLIDQISNPWVRFKVQFDILDNENEKRFLAKKAFLYVIGNISSEYQYKAQDWLDEIIRVCPKVIDAIRNEEILEHFQRFCDEAKRRNEPISLLELNWVNEYVKDATTRNQIEKILYRMFLGSSSYWDKKRHRHAWTLSKSDIDELVYQTLWDENVGSKRKMELAIEFNLPKDKFVKAYYVKLLRDGHYEKARELGVHELELVIRVIIEKINELDTSTAIQIAERIIPDRKDIIEEIRNIHLAS